VRGGFLSFRLGAVFSIVYVFLDNRRGRCEPLLYATVQPNNRAAVR